MSGFKKENKYLLKNTFLLFLGNFGSKFISFFLVPLYTNYMTTLEYGTVDFMVIICTVIIPIITFNISESVMRYEMDKNKNENAIIGAGIFVWVISLLITLILFPFLKIYNVTTDYALLLSIYIGSFSLSQILLCFLRGREQLLKYSIINIIQTLIIACTNILLLCVLRKGINGYIISFIIGYVITILLCLIYGKVLKNIKNMIIDKAVLYSMLKYSIVLIPYSLMWWIMNSLDKVMITNMISFDANGLYAVSYKLPSIIIIFTTIFNQAWMFSAVKQKDSDNKDEYTQKIYDLLFDVVLLFSVLIILVLKPLMRIYAGVDFFESWIYTVPLIVGSAFLTLGTFISNEYSAHKDNWGFLKTSALGAIVNIILNIILINLMGIIGAALATCISYIIVFSYRAFDTRKYIKIKIIDIKKTIIIFILVISSIAVYIDGCLAYIINTLLFIMMIFMAKDTIKTFFRNGLGLLNRKKEKNDMLKE